MHFSAPGRIKSQFQKKNKQCGSEAEYDLGRLVPNSDSHSLVNRNGHHPHTENGAATNLRVPEQTEPEIPLLIF